MFVIQYMDENKEENMDTDSMSWRWTICSQTMRTILEEEKMDKWNENNDMNMDVEMTDLDEENIET